MSDKDIIILIVLVVVIYFVYTYSWTGLKNLSPTDFEKRCAEWLEKQGYKTELTRTTKDGGKDIIVRDQDGKIIGYAECKHHKRPIGVEKVRAFHGVMRGKKGWFFSLNGFTDDVKAEFIRKKNLILVDGEELLK